MVCRKLDGSTVGFGGNGCLPVLGGTSAEHDDNAGDDGVSASSTTGLSRILRFALASWEIFAARTLGSMTKYTCSLNTGVFPCKGGCS